MKIENKKILHTDILIIGGGTAGCYAALTIREKSDYSIIIAEKANIKRSGCLAAGVNAINAYIVKGRKPEDYVDYAKKDADGIVREDLLMTMSEGLNRVTDKMEKLGLVILKDENGEYVARGNRNIKINGENMKPILAEAVSKLTDCTVINRINITDYIVENNTIKGASHIDHAISVAAHRTINAHRADLRTQLHSTQRIQAPADAVPGWWHVDDGQRLAHQPLPVMPDQTDVRQSVQPLA